MIPTASDPQFRRKVRLNNRQDRNGTGVVRRDDGQTPSDADTAI